MSGPLCFRYSSSRPNIHCCLACFLHIFSCKAIFFAAVTSSRNSFCSCFVAIACSLCWRKSPHKVKIFIYNWFIQHLGCRTNLPITYHREWTITSIPVRSSLPKWPFCFHTLYLSVLHVSLAQWPQDQLSLPLRETQLGPSCMSHTLPHFVPHLLIECHICIWILLINEDTHGLQTTLAISIPRMSRSGLMISLLKML